MKKLTQADFDNAPCWIQSAAINSDGRAYFYECRADDLLAETIRGAWDVMVGNDCYLFFGEYDATNWENSAIDRELDNKNQPQEPYFLMKGDLFYRHSYRGYSDFSAWAGVYDKDEAIAYAEKSGGSVIAKPARNFYHEPEEIDRMIERLQLIRQALRDSPNGY